MRFLGGDIGSVAVIFGWRAREEKRKVKKKSRGMVSEVEAIRYEADAESANTVLLLYC